jgi:hypothetical protein
VPTDVLLGRLRLPTIYEGMSDDRGAAVEQVGRWVGLGTAAPRARSLRLPIHPTGAEATTVGDRKRRQALAMMSNDQLRSQGIPFTFAATTDVSGVLMIGGASVEEEEGGFTLGEYSLNLRDCYVIATPSTHREGRRQQTMVLWHASSTAYRDTRRTHVPPSGDFSNQGSLLPGLLYLPPGVSDPAATYGRPQELTYFRTPQGGVGTVAIMSEGDQVTVTYERAITPRDASDVVILDRRGATSPSLTVAGDLDPETVYGWEEVYGREQPLTSGDIPVIQNGLCRLRWLAANSAFVLEYFNVATSLYVEIGRVTLWDATSTTAATQLVTLRGASVVEWTPERGVIQANFTLGTSGGATKRYDCLITLQRGWIGPRIELYGKHYDASKPGAAVRVSMLNNAAMSYTTRSRPASVDSTVASPAAGDKGTFATIENWVAAYTAGVRPIYLGVQRQNVRFTVFSDTAAYGATRPAVAITAADGTTEEGYVSVNLGVSPVASLDVERRASGEGLDGASDHGGAMAYESRSVPEWVPR